MKARATLLAAVCGLVVASGCGDDDGPPSSEQVPVRDAATTTTGPAPPPVGPETTLQVEDKRGVALACLRDEQGVPVAPVGDKGIDITSDDDARIDFYQSSLEAEGEQFEGRAEGAQQIGAALFYIGDLPEEELVAVEECLNEQ